MTGESSFAPPERKDKDEVLADSRALVSKPELQLLIKAVPECAAVLNEYRQILVANESLLGLLSEADLVEIVGSRPGEALGCVHAWDSPAGCGTGERCRYCGAAAAIVGAFETGEKATHECRITAQTGSEIDALDLLVTANPITVEGRRLLILTLADISDAKRRRSLEQTFFHDVMNSAVALSGLIELLRDGKEGETREELDHLVDLSGRLVGEIGAQRDLLAAESGELLVLPEPIVASVLLQKVAAQLRYGTLVEGKHLEVSEPEGEVALRTDNRLLFRILTNMLKNALESTPEGGTATAGVEEYDGGVRFWARNPEAMTSEVRLQVFQRSFSTKSPSRGLGAYSMKLIGERYLKGEVSFTTSQRDGTEFSITLPRDLQKPTSRCQAPEG